MIALSTVEELEHTVDQLDVDVDICKDDDDPGLAQVMVWRDGILVYHRVAVPLENLDLETQFLTVLIGGGAL